MGQYKVYFSISIIIGVLAIYNASLFLFYSDYEGLLYLMLLQLPLGLVQLTSALHYVTSLKSYPNWFQDFISTYWWHVFAYFVGLYILFRFFEYEDLAIQIWLFAVPWPIAIFQFCYVYRLYRHESENDFQ